MIALMARMERECNDALKSGDAKRLAVCLRWVRDAAKASVEQMEVGRNAKEVESLSRNLDLIETKSLVGALARRSKGLVLGVIVDISPDKEELTTAYRGGFTLTYGIINRVYDEMSQCSALEIGSFEEE